MKWDELVTVGMGDYPKDGEPFTALSGKRENLVKFFDAVFDKKHKLEISMPCGTSKTFSNHNDIPIEDLPCPCGNRNHTVIKIDS